jgi:hypothetical protein
MTACAHFQFLLSPWLYCTSHLATLGDSVRYDTVLAAQSLLLCPSPLISTFCIRRTAVVFIMEPACVLGLSLFENAFAFCESQRGRRSSMALDPLADGEVDSILGTATVTLSVYSFSLWLLLAYYA